MSFDAPHELPQICLLGWSQVFVVTCPIILLRRLGLAAIGLFSWGTWCIQTDTHPLSQSVLCNSALSCEPTRNLFCGHVRPDTTPEPIAASGGKEALLCVRISHYEFHHLHEINAVSLWCSPDVGTSLLYILVDWNVEPVGKYRECGSTTGLSYPG